MVLESINRQKRFFKESSKEDVQLAKTFFAEYRWGSEGCPFILEYPYQSIPDMIKDKLLYKVFGLSFERKEHWSI